MHSILGAVEVENDPQAWPLSSLIANASAPGEPCWSVKPGMPSRPSALRVLILGFAISRRPIDALREAGGPAQAPRAVESYNRQATAGCNQPHRGVDLLNGRC
jgi:hypothetical protein